MNREDKSNFNIENYELEKKVYENSRLICFTGFNTYDHNICNVYISKEKNNHQGTISLFLEELKIVKENPHSSILKVLDFGISDDYNYVVTEWYDSISFDLYLDEKKSFNFSLSRIFINMIASGISSLYEHGILYRYIYPKFFLINHSFRNRIIKLVFLSNYFFSSNTEYDKEEDEYLLESYLPLESLINIGRNESIYSSFYSLGVFFYHITTSYNPFYVENTSDIIRRKMGENNVSIDKIRGLTDPLKMLLSNIIDKRCENRKYDISNGFNETLKDEKHLSFANGTNESDLTNFEKIIDNRFLRGESLIIQVESRDIYKKLFFFKDIAFSKTSSNISYIRIDLKTKSNYIMLFKSIINNWYKNIYLNYGKFRKSEVDSIIVDSLSINRDIFTKFNANFCEIFNDFNKIEDVYFELERISIAMIEFLKVISKFDNGLLISIEGFNFFEDSELFRFIDLYVNLKGYPIVFVISEKLKSTNGIDIFTFKLNKLNEVRDLSKTAILSNIREDGLAGLLDQNSVFYNIANNWSNDISDKIDMLVLISLSPVGIGLDILSSIFGNITSKINYLLQYDYIEKDSITGLYSLTCNDFFSRINNDSNIVKIKSLYFKLIEYLFSFNIEDLSDYKIFMLYKSLCYVEDERSMIVGKILAKKELSNFNLFTSEEIYEKIVKENSQVEKELIVNYAKVKYYLGEYSEEIDYLKNVINESRVLKNDHIILENLAETYRKVGKYYDAIVMNNKRLQLYGESVHRSNFFDTLSVSKGVLNHLGSLFFPKLNRFERKKDKHKKIIDIYRKLNWIYRLSDNRKIVRNTVRILNLSELFFYKEKEHALAYMEFAVLLSAIGFRKLAKFYTVKAFSIYESFDKDNISGDLYMGKGFTELWDGNYSDAKISFEIAINKFYSHCDFWNLSMAYNGLGLIYLARGDYKSVHFFKKNLEVSLKLNNVIGKSISLQTLGDAFTENGNFSKAKEYLHESLQIAKKSQDKYMQMVTNISLCKLFIEQEDFEKATVYLEHAELLESTNVFMAEYSSQVYQLRAIITIVKIEESIMKDGDKKSFYYLNSIVNKMMKKTQNSPNLLYLSYFIKAQYYVLIDNYKKANVFFSKSINGLYSLGRKYDLGRVLYGYSEFLKLDNRYSESVKILNESFFIFEKIGAKKYVEKIKYYNKMEELSLNKNYTDIVDNKHWFSSTEDIIKEILRIKTSQELYKYLLSALKVRYNIFSGDIYEYQSSSKKLVQVKSYKNELFDKTIPLSKLKESYDNNITISGKIDSDDIGIFDVYYYIIPIQSGYQKFGVVYFDYSIESNLDRDEIFEAKLFCEYAAVSLERIVLNDLKNKRILKLEKKYGETEKHISILKKFVSTKTLSDVFIYKKTPELGGMEENKTILLSDIRNFTEISTLLNATDTIGLLNSYFKTVEKPIAENNGIIDKFMGDGMLAVFDTANDAVNASIAMIEELDKYNELRKEYNYSAKIDIGEIRIGIGLASGKVIVGNMGNKIKMDFTVIGNAVNLAQRIEALNKEYNTNIMIDNSVYRNLIDKDRYGIRSLDRVVVKGVSKSIKIYEVFQNEEEVKSLKAEYMHVLNNAFEMANDIKHNGINYGALEINNILLELDEYEKKSISEFGKLNDKSFYKIKETLTGSLENYVEKSI